MRKTSFIMIVSAIVLACTMSSWIAFAQDRDGKINLNTATKEELIGIGLDAGLAERIIELRNQNGEFVDLEELQEIDGVDSKLLRQLEKKIFIEPAAGCAC